MRIALCSSSVPFVQGGYRNIVDWLDYELKAAGHQVERIYIPFVDEANLILKQCAVYRWIDLSAADRVICFRSPAHMISHPHKILWFIHHIRVFYDLWDSSYRGFLDDEYHRNLRDILHKVDTAAINEAKHIFTNSKIVAERLKHFNNIDSEVLYPPVLHSERFYCKHFNNEIVMVCRIEHHKRQHLLIEAMQHTCSEVKLRICGASSGESYVRELEEMIMSFQLEDKVYFDNRWISESEKVEIFSECLASAYLPFDEDSYGYPSLESSYASKPVLTTSDSGGVLELVEDGYNGFVVDADPKALAEAMDRLYIDRNKTEQMGRNAANRIIELNISWQNVLERLLS